MPPPASRTRVFGWTTLALLLVLLHGWRTPPLRGQERAAGTVEVLNGVVEAQGRSVDLTSDHLLATRITSGQPPTSPTPMARDEVQRLFGDVMRARAPQPLQFLLCFETGGDQLTTTSQAELARAIEAIGNRPFPDVAVIGDTDTAADRAANQALGLRRAALITEQLVAAGIPITQIDATSRGEADLLVSTPDGVAEARNRRVESSVR